jgi:RNA polymerase sigma factor (sigma-70 family)
VTEKTLSDSSSAGCLIVEMQEKPDAQLLRAYLEGDEVAFREIVSRHTDLVYSAALRQVNSPDLAQDIAQSVFVDLVRKTKQVSDRLTPEASLAGWLYRSTRFAVLNRLRDDQRRARHERQAMEQLITDTSPAPDWERIRPHLDEAMAELSDDDRDALLLRYFKNHDFHTVGRALGLSDDAAQKRVSRAVERLREFFFKRGVTIGVSALVLLISANAVQAAPLTLVAAISTAAILGGTATHTSTAIATTKVIAMTALQKTLVAATLAVVAGTGIYEAHQASQLREQNQTLRQHQGPPTEQISQLQKERDTATSELADLRAENSRLKSDSNETELLKLRSEVTQLKNAAEKMENDPMLSAAKDLLAKVQQLKERVDQLPEKKIPEIQFLTPTDWMNLALNPSFTNDMSAYSMSQLRIAAKDKFAPLLAQALRNYTQASDGRLPNDLSQLKPYFDSTVGDEILGRYKLVHTGNLSDVPPGDMLVGEKAVVDERVDSLYTIGLNRFTFKFITGNGIRGVSAGEVTKYIQGLPVTK